MAYVVKAGFVSAETKVDESGSRATVDFYRGAELPGDVPDEQVQGLLRLGHVEEVEAGAEPASEPEPPGDELVGLDKDALLALAAEEGVEVDKRLGVDKLAAAIRDARAAK